MAVRSEFESSGNVVGSERLSWRGLHPWHTDTRQWPSANDRLDAWIETLHALGADPAPVLMPAFAADFEGDQWTSVAVSPQDLWSCYGIGVDDMTVWRPLLAHVVAQLDRGNAVMVEVDAFHLPASPACYQRAHQKTVIVATGYERHTHRLRYLSGSGGAFVGGEDLDALLTAGIGSAQLAPSVQIVKLDRLTLRTPADRAVLAIALARMHGTRMPTRNPFRAFSDALREHGAWLSGGDDEHFRKWAQATLQQCGAAFELSAHVTAWLETHGEAVGAAVPHLHAIAHGARTLQVKLSRAPQAGRMPDVSATLAECAHAWDDAMTILRPRYGL